MKDFEDAMLEVAWNNLDTVIKRFYSLDNKSAGIITISGIFFSLLEGIGNGENLISNVLFLVTGISFIVTIILAILALRTMEIGDVSTNNLLKELNNDDEKEKIMRIVATMGNAEDLWRERSTKKAAKIGMAIYALGLSVLLMIATILSQADLTFIL
ncbi:hypothetical protein FTO70_03710 [Methanosarcina sp. KYL-1]|uniref:hypothetical protein n=1 Tax=Methanosarcina sp. KYL-1 TaxID=2602068 RepID=UPI0021019E7C|nr:hypothetical protein [Methanosarcina sp. KYL-1]MCQ1534810.1 hypothetical protein [Methanosarcina sp. KYL-1]